VALHMTGVSPGARREMVRVAKEWRALLDGVGVHAGGATG
jgi:hypothetical protein